MTITRDPVVPLDALGDVFASPSMTTRAPGNHFPELEQDPRDVYQLVHDELLLGGVARMNLATFCTTWVEPEVRQLMAESLDKNIVDKDEYPRTAELESRCVHMLANLFHAPDSATTVGTSTVGSSDVAMLGGLAAKWRWRAARRTGRQGDRQPEHGVWRDGRPDQEPHEASFHAPSPRRIHPPRPGAPHQTACLRAPKDTSASTSQMKSASTSQKKGDHMRRFLIWLGIGAIAAAAYTYGTRAGHGRYREIKATAETLWNDPRVKKARARAVKEADRAAHSVARRARRIGR